LTLSRPRPLAVPVGAAVAAGAVAARILEVASSAIVSLDRLFCLCSTTLIVKIEYNKAFWGSFNKRNATDFMSCN
jgi:hypothetical protein